MDSITDNLKFCDIEKALLIARKCIQLGTYFHATDCDMADCAFNIPKIRKLIRYGGRDEYRLLMRIELSVPYVEIEKTFGPQGMHFRRDTCTNEMLFDHGQMCFCKNPV